jgi:cytochrome P450
MLWVIYELSRRRNIQATLRDEILSVAPRGTPPTAKLVQKMPYLKGFVKEVLR